MAVNTTTLMTLPAMGESVREGTVLEWHKQEGDAVAEGETIVEVSTDKVDAEVPAPASGTLTRIVAAAGDDGRGRRRARRDRERRPRAAATATRRDARSRARRRRRARRRAPAEPGGELPPHTAPEIVDIVTPAGGESVTEGTILEWAVAVGDEVADGQTVVELSTDKVDMELPAPAAGVITEILAAAGETVHVGQVIARMMQTGAVGQRRRRDPPTRAARRPPPRRRGRPRAGNGAHDGAPISPVARRVAAAEGVDLAAVHGSGPAGRITKADVLAAKAAADRPGASPPPRPPPRRRRRHRRCAAAPRCSRATWSESREVPTATSFRTMTVTVMDARRRELKAAGHKLSFTHLIAYAIARAATDEMPVMAHHFAEIDGKPHVVDDGAVNLGIAVDVEKKDGTPHAHGAGHPRRRPAELPRSSSTRSRELIAGARDNTLTADELTGANISLTNPGGIGTVASVPRLMAGQGTIVATGAIAYPVGLAAVGAHDRRREGHDDDLDLRPPRHPGRGVRALPQGRRGAPAGRARLLRADLRRARRRSSARRPRRRRRPPPPRPPRDARRRAPAPDGVALEELLQAVQAATSLVKAHRTHGHLAARLDPLGTEPEGDPGARPRAARPDARDHGAASRRRSCACTCRARRSPTRCRTCARRTAARSPTRSSTSPRTASARGCARRSSPARSARR